MEESLQCATQQIEINAIIIESTRNEQIKILLVLKQVFEIIDNLGKKIDNAKRYKIAKPFLKWLGGKTQIIRTILNKTPCEFNNYHELFVGGGSVLLGILSLIQNKKIKINGNIFAYDSNEGLINTYKQIQKNKNKLCNIIQSYIQKYDSCVIIEKSEVNRNPETEEDAIKSKENFYYWMRKKFNRDKKNTVESAALFIVINKTTFRGMYREGPNGFNVPYGHYKTTPSMLTKRELTNISALIQNVKFICCDFEESFKNIQKNDYIYLDPPYAPETTTSFVNYNADGFGIEKHTKLFELIKMADVDKVKFCMSNANVKLVSDNFKKYNIEQIKCKRSINSKNPQSTSTEVIITNF